MNNNQIKKNVIRFVALSGVVVNAAYGIGLLNVLFANQYNNEIREILISGIALEFGWVALLGWVIFKPFEGRSLLLFTIIPILLGNILHSANQFMNFHKSIGTVALNVGIGLLYSALYVGAYFLGKSGEKK